LGIAFAYPEKEEAGGAENGEGEGERERRTHVLV
jgi:hypothetical protein